MPRWLECIVDALIVLVPSVLLMLFAVQGQ